MEAQPTNAPINLEIPDGISPAAVAARKAALIAAGTDPLHAERIALEAERQQAAHENPDTRPGALPFPVQGRGEAEALAATIQGEHGEKRAVSERASGSDAEPPRATDA